MLARCFFGLDDAQDGVDGSRTFVRGSIPPKRTYSPWVFVRASPRPIECYTRSGRDRARCSQSTRHDNKLFPYYEKIPVSHVHVMFNRSQFQSSLLKTIGIRAISLKYVDTFSYHDVTAPVCRLVFVCMLVLLGIYLSSFTSFFPRGPVDGPWRRGPPVENRIVGQRWRAAPVSYRCEWPRISGASQPFPCPLTPTDVVPPRFVLAQDVHV